MGAYASVIHVKVIVMLLTGKQGAAEAGADLESLGGRQAHHCPGEVRLQFVEDGCTESRRAASNDSLDGAPQGVAFGPGLLDESNHFLNPGGVAGAHDIAFDLLGGHRIRVNLGSQVANGGDPGEDFDAGNKSVEHLAGNGSSGNPSNGFPGGGSPPSLPVPDSILCVVSVVGVGGSVFGGHFLVCCGTRILVAHQDSYG